VGVFCCIICGSAAHASLIIIEVHTDMARYNPGAPVKISVTLQNPADAGTFHGAVSLACAHLGERLKSTPGQSFALAPGARTTLNFSWKPPTTDFQGYLVDARARDSSGRVVDDRTTAVDVSSSWLRFPRYGYLTTFGDQSRRDSMEEVQGLASYHINALQFYDWQYKHDVPLAGSPAHPAGSWPDIASTPTRPIINERETVLDLIAAAHSFGMSAMNYNLLYGAWRNYSVDGVSFRWGLWKKPNGTDQDSIPLPKDWQTDVIYLFNPANLDWQNYLFKQEAAVFTAYPFDGWHVDQVGDRGTVYDHAGQPISLAATFAPFLNRARARLNKTIVFNNVGGYGLKECARDSNEDAAYVECWEWTGQKTYNDLKNVIDESAAASDGAKSTILAAYMDKGYANSRSSDNPGIFNLPGVLLTDAAIFASGGDHIEMGDRSQMLCSEYFPNHNLKLSAGSRLKLHSYYDFLVAYENLLRGGLLNATNKIVLDRDSSTNGAPGAVWTFAKNGVGYRVLHLINLMGEKSSDWRDNNADYPAPTSQENVEVRYYYQRGAVRRVSWASPDVRGGNSLALPFKTGEDANGRFVRFTVPRLDYWDIVILRIKPERSRPALSKRRAAAPAASLRRGDT